MPPYQFIQSMSCEPIPPQPPSWVNGGELCTEALKAEVCACAKKLFPSSPPSSQREGGDQLYQLIMTVWALETSIARDAADIVCDDIRLVG